MAGLLRVEEEIDRLAAQLWGIPEKGLEGINRSTARTR
jgi:hypothetical protein